MIDVALCIATEHDPWLVALAVFICCAGAFSIVQMLERARNTTPLQRFGWSFLTAVAAGATIWSTHFVAMLAYRAQVPVDLDPVMTIASLIIAVVGSIIAFGVATARGGPVWSAIGGMLFGGAISAMHFMGMAAYHVDGIISWRTGYVAAALICAIVFSAAALVVLDMRRIGRARIFVGTGLIVTGIATLHFVAMTALHITPLALSDTPLNNDEIRALGLATALVGLIVIGAGVFASLNDAQTRADAIRRLRHMAMFDALTGLPNRASFQESLARRLTQARASHSRVALLAIDLDRFKEINDVHGHKAGDEVLSLLAQRMRDLAGPTDVVARLGGDEFVAVVDANEDGKLARFAELLDATLRAPLTVGGFVSRVGASIGIAVYPEDGADIEALTNNADLAMYRAKSRGATAPCRYDADLDEAIRERRDLANDLRIALENGELDLHYQVQATVNRRRVTGYEALVRWTHPTRGPIGPATFIPIAEEHGLILSLGEWVLRRACNDAVKWKHKAKVAVNVSPLQLAHAELPRLFHQVLLETGLPPRRLEIELTESAIMADRERALHVLRQIKALGVSVALDDFGTGYSSLETLRAFPFDKIKLDRLFAQELEISPQATAIIRAVLALGRSLSIPVLAEGVETPEQLSVLLQEGCDEVQGFLLGRPSTGAAHGEALPDLDVPVVPPRGTARDAA